MFRGSKNKKQTRPAKQICPARPRTILLSVLTAAALAAGGGIFGVRPASAAGYVFQPHTLNAGVLVNGSDPAPYLFYVLNNRPDVRPVDLNLVNPLAPAGALPSMAAYWEVSLNGVSDSQLARYNVLYLRADGIQFTPNVNEKLRRFVDGGGQLIVEYDGAPSTISATGLFTGTGAVSGSGMNVAFPAASASLSLKQPIVSQPYLLSQDDLNAFVATSSPDLYILRANLGDTVHADEFNSLFSTALVDSAGTVVSTAQIGAGQVVASTLNIGQGIGGAYAATFASVNFAAASTPDLKLLANILTWSEAHPSENKTSYGNASSTGLASFSPAWQYGVPTAAGATPPPPSGAAVWGNFVFAVNADGVLRAFDAYPSENLTGGANADDGTATFADTGKSYDRIWEQGNLPGASAPTVASVNNVNYVFVEKNDGSVVSFDAVTGGTGLTLNYPTAGSHTPFAGQNAPGPTVYDGRLYAGQADGTMHVYDLNNNTTGVVVTLNPSPPASGSGTTEAVVAAPSVGTLADGNTNILIAVVPTNLNVYTLLLGGRNEPLVPYPSFGAQSGYSISRQGRYDLPNIFADIGAIAPALRAYQFDGTSLLTPNTSIPSPPAPQDPLFLTTDTSGYFTDWNMDFFNAGGGTLTPGTPGTPVNLNFISASPYGELNSVTAVASTAVLSAPAIARNGDYYYTETQGTNSYLIGVRNNPLYSRVQLKFRFRVPITADATKYAATVNGATILWDYKDADVDYNDTNYNNTGINASLVGYHFVGAPVVDDQDNVYVAATNGTNATVLCFRGNQEVSASPAAANATTVDLTSDTITQADEGVRTTPNTPLLNTPFKGDGTFGQYTASLSSIQFYNFGKQIQTARQIAGNVTEPQPLTATSNDTAATGTPLLMHTNLAWFVAPFPLATTTVNGATTVSQITGLTQVGSSLLLTDGASLYRLSANPLVATGRVVSTGPSVAPIGAGTVASAPSVGGSVLVINGTNGLVARTRQVTVIADANRILGVDGDGNAVWAVDATTRTDATQNPPVSTKVGFSHPTALSQFAPNDYLVADPGSSRCVRFDSGGNVRWELTRFQDPQGLLGAGQPLTLSQPSSVVTRTAIVPAGAASYAGDTATYYLVADSGNNRIVEVADFVSSAGVTDGNHVLTWASHTGDRYGRSYRYGSAAYYLNSTIRSGISIAATVTNTRLAPLTAGGGLGPVSGDAAGGSLVVFNYPLPPLAFGATPTVTSPANDLVYTTAGFYAATGTGAGAVYTPFTIRSPRFLQLYVPSATAAAPNSAVAPFDFLYADDNGAFDLTYDANRGAFVAGADRLQFKTPDYRTMSYPVAGFAISPAVPAVGVSNTTDTTTNTGTTILYTNLRQNLPFVPTCIQALSLDSQTGTTGTVRRYLITQNYSQGELGSVNSTTTGPASNTVVTNIGKLGGEVFEVDVTYSPVTGTSVITPGGFGVNATLSHPNLTGPLTQPTYAVRLP